MSNNRTDEEERPVKIAVLTSGGDCCGMNAALKAIVRKAQKEKAVVYGVKYGYLGLIRNRITELDWNWTRRLSSEGGTVLRTARCSKFMTKKGQKKAARNLIKLGINNLIVIGGDGTLQGALELKKRYRKLYSKMVERGVLEGEQKGLHDINIVGIPGTIDCDIYGTDVTLGADTALNRIVEVAGNLNSTMRSHHRICIIETMGNKCGWLALMTGIALDADYILVPEVRKEWREELVKTVSLAVEYHKADILVVVSEGATEVDGTPITMAEVAKELSTFEPRTLRVGHIQRGGCPSARDVMFGALSGITAVDHLIGSKYSNDSDIPENKGVMVGICDGKVKLVDLKWVISENKRTDKIIMKGEPPFDRRSEMFKIAYRRYENHRICKLSKYGSEGSEGRDGHTHNHNTSNSPSLPKHNSEVSNGSAESRQKEGSSTPQSHLSISTMPLIRQIGDLRTEPSSNYHSEQTSNEMLEKEDFLISKNLRIGILNNGEVSAGMNACLNMLVQTGLSIGHDMLYFPNGSNNMRNIKEAGPFQFRKESCSNGAAIGTSNTHLKVARIERWIKTHNLDWLIIIGELRSIGVVKELNKVILIPTETNERVEQNNSRLKLWDMCLGFDSRLNGLLKVANICKTAGCACERVVYLIEVPSRRQCVGGALVCGAFDVFCGIFEDPKSDSIQELERIKEKVVEYFKAYKKAGVVIFRSMDVMPDVSTDSLSKMLSEDTNFTVRHCVPGPLCDGNLVSPYDLITSSLVVNEVMDAISNGSSGRIAGFTSGKATLLTVDGLLALLAGSEGTTELEEMLKYCRLFGC